MNKIVSTNAVVAKALAMNGWDSKMGWEFESKIEAAVKRELGTVTDVGAAFRDGELATGGNRNGAITVGLYDDKARKNIGKIKQIVEKILKQYGGGRITSQKVVSLLERDDAVEFAVVRNSRAMNASWGSDQAKMVAEGQRLIKSGTSAERKKWSDKAYDMVAKYGDIPPAIDKIWMNPVFDPFVKDMDDAYWI